MILEILSESKTFKQTNPIVSLTFHNKCRLTVRIKCNLKIHANWYEIERDAWKSFILLSKEYSSCRVHICCVISAFFYPPHISVNSIGDVECSVILLCRLA